MNIIKIVIGALVLALPLGVNAQAPKEEPLAVAIIDSGIEKAPHLDKIIGYRYDMRIGRKDKKINSDHGTLIASIIAENVNRQIIIHSFRADIKCKKDEPCDLDASAIGVSIRNAISLEVDLIQISIAGDLGEKAINAIRAAADAGIHVVLSAGNNGLRSKTADAASGLGSFVHVVGALDEKGRRADFTSRSRKDDVILEMRQGVNVKSRDANGQIKLVTGTSFAAPLYAAELLNGMPRKVSPILAYKE